MTDLLTSAKFGFPANQVVLLTNPAPPHPRPGVTILPASQTTHDGILAAMQKYLVDIPKKGDTVVFYDASHGSLRVNSKGNKLTVLVGGKYVHADSTLVPSDAYTGGYDVRDREMTRIFNAALDKGVHLTVIFDSCHSGGITRGIGPKYVERTLAFDPRDINEAPDTQTPPSERKENPALIFSAAQQDETAKETLTRLKPAFKKDGTVTAGNAPGTNDGAAAVVVTSERNAARLGKQPMARIVAQAVSGVEPKWVMMAPVEAVEKLLAKTGWDRDKDVDLVELNEAFAVAAIAVTRQLKLNPDKVNVNGGAVALGHPIGASGARILVTLLYELQRRNLRRGIAALCLGGGNAVALAVEIAARQ